MADNLIPQKYERYVVSIQDSINEDGKFSVSVKGLQFNDGSHHAHSTYGKPVEIRRALRNAVKCNCDYCSGKSAIEDQSSPAMGRINVDESHTESTGEEKSARAALVYRPYPEVITREYTGYEAAYGLDDPNLDKGYGKITSVGEDGWIWINFGKKKPQKCNPKDVRLVAVQHDHGIMFVSNRFFDGIDMTLPDQQIQEQVREQYNAVLKRTSGGRERKRDPLATRTSGRKSGHRSTKKKAKSKAKSSNRKKKVASGKADKTADKKGGPIRVGSVARH